jgi:hypothetical protein
LEQPKNKAIDNAVSELGTLIRSDSALFNAVKNILLGLAFKQYCAGVQDGKEIKDFNSKNK